MSIVNHSENSYNTDISKKTKKNINNNELDLYNKDFKYLGLAAEIAETSKMLMRHGAVVTCKNQVIGCGYNENRIQFKDNFIGNACSLHAEMNALRQAFMHNPKTALKQNLTMYVVRCNKSGKLIDSAPCANCHKKMMESGIRTVVYSSPEGKIIKQYIKDYIPRRDSRTQENYTDWFVKEKCT
jgi:deoxycytidylate deaminase